MKNANRLIFRQCLANRSRLWTQLAYIALGAIFFWAEPESAEAEFVEVTAAAGIDFLHRNGATAEKYAPEAMGSGLAFLDYDNDGWLDLYFVNSAGPAALYRNTGDGGFVAVTERAGVGNSGFGMGCASADYDNDGDLDLYITSYGANILYRNTGDGRFVDETVMAGVGDTGLGVGTAFADYDQDGWVDLYVANYAVYPPDPFIQCYRKGVPIYCGPESFEPQPDAFYRNRGDGTFVDVAEEVGLLPRSAIEFGGVFADYDDDGDPDLYCPADGSPNLLYRNDSGRFVEVGVMAGVAYSDEGKPLSGMGCAAGDYDNDGLTDIYVTNYQWETDSFYRNLSDLFFIDQAYDSGVGMPSIKYLAWGAIFVDYDRDGHRDLFISTGHHDDNVEQFDAVKYAMQNRLFANDGNGRYRDVTDGAGPGLALVQVSRGAAAGDYDNDGDLDLAVLNSNQPAALLRNEWDNANHWLSLKLVGAGAPCSNRAGIGARVKITAGDLVQMAEVRSGDSYLSQSDLRLFFGLGKREEVDRMEIRWPGGTLQELTAVQADQILTIEELCKSGG